MPEVYTGDTFEVGPLTVRIVQDEDPMDPRDYDNLGIMLCSHRSYDLGDMQVSEGFMDDYENLTAYLVAEHDALPDTVMPLYLFDHSGLSMRTDPSGFAAADSAGWDWGQVGVIFATEATIAKVGMPVAEDGTPTERIRECLAGEVATYDLYLQGGFVGFVVEDAAGDVLDSCWGFDDPSYCAQEGIEAAKAEPAYKRAAVTTAAQLAGVGL